MIIITLLTIPFAFMLNLMLIPRIIKKAHQKKWYDLPDHRKVHTGLIPRLGGLGIFTAFLAACLLMSLLVYLINGEWSGILNRSFLPIFAAIALIHLVGLIDDFRSQKAIVKLILQIVAAAIIVSCGFTINSLRLPFLGNLNLGFFAYPLTILWIIGITNAFNLVDGMDGLAGGIGAFATLSMGVISLLQNHLSAAIVSFALFGAISGFLRYNLPPARIFMGDSGSLLIGFVLSVVPLMGLSKTASFGTVIVPVTLLIVPIMDTLAAIFRRIKGKRTIMSPDKEHIHHILLDMGLTEKKILFLIYSVCLYLSIVAITTVIVPNKSNVYVILIVWIGSILGYRLIHYLKNRKILLQLEKTHSKNSA